MYQVVGKIKTGKDDWKWKDWERRNKVIGLLQQKRVTITEMSQSIGERIQHVSTCVWGIPGRKNPRIEKKIALYLGTTQDELFSTGVDF